MGILKESDKKNIISYILKFNNYFIFVFIYLKDLFIFFIIIKYLFEVWFIKIVLK